MTIRVQWRPLADVQEWAGDWDALVTGAPHALPMLSHAWVDAYAATLMPTGADLWCGLAFDDDGLAGVLPLVRHHSGPLCHLSTPYHHHSGFGDVAVLPRKAPGVVAALLGDATREFGHRLRSIALRGVVADSPTVAALGGSSVRTLCSRRGDGSVLRIAGEWERYQAGLSKNFRANLRKVRNRFRKEVSAAPVTRWLRADEVDATALDAFLDIEASGWKGRAGTAIAAIPQLTGFYQRLAANARRRCWLELHFLRAGDDILAAQFGLRLQRRLILLKIAYDERFARYGPGNMLFEATAERAFRLGDTDEVNCLTDMAWHRGWKMARRQYLDLRLFPRTGIGWVCGWFPRVVIGAGRDFARHLAALHSGRVLQRDATEDGG